MKPNARPRIPNFSPVLVPSVPVGRPKRCRTRWSAARIAPRPARPRLQEVLDRSRALLGSPKDYRLGIVPASDTGAVEMALWSMLGARGVDVLTWESFGEGWATDVVKQLKLKDARVLDAPYGKLPDLRQVDWRPRRGVSLERHHLGRARAEWRLDRRRPRGPGDLRRHLGGLRDGPAVGQARCRHLVLAEGAGRRGGARHARAQPARGRAARKLHAALAAAQDLPPDLEGQIQRGDLPGRDHQHAVDAGGRGCDRRPEMGGKRSAARRR